MLFTMYNIKTHDSELQGQEETGCLFTCNITQKLADAVNKPPQK